MCNLSALGDHFILKVQLGWFIGVASITTVDLEHFLSLFVQNSENRKLTISSKHFMRKELYLNLFDI